MRKLTKKEKYVCKALLKNDNGTPRLIGDVLCELYGINCIEKESLGEFDDYPFKIRMSINAEKYDEIVENLNEAIALIRVLEEKGMIYLRPNSIVQPIGKKENRMRLQSEPKIDRITMMDLSCNNSWILLNSYYYITNGFKDYVNHKYRTIETRRHCQMLGVSVLGVVVAIIIAVLTTLRENCFYDTNNDRKQEQMINQNEDFEEETTIQNIQQSVH